MTSTGSGLSGWCTCSAFTGVSGQPGTHGWAALTGEVRKTSDSYALPVCAHVCVACVCTRRSSPSP